MAHVASFVTFFHKKYNRKLKKMPERITTIRKKQKNN